MGGLDGWSRCHINQSVSRGVQWLAILAHDGIIKSSVDGSLCRGAASAWLTMHRPRKGMVAANSIQQIKTGEGAGVNPSSVAL